jgi:hypothetical protein
MQITVVVDGQDAQVVRWAAAQRGQTVEGFARDQVYGIAHLMRWEHDHPGVPFPGWGAPDSDVTDPAVITDDYSRS